MHLLRGLSLIPLLAFCVLVVLPMTYLGPLYLTGLIVLSLLGWFGSAPLAAAYALVGWQIYLALAIATAPMLLFIDARPHLSTRYGLWWYVRNDIHARDWGVLLLCMCLWPVSWPRINFAFRDNGQGFAESVFFAVVRWLETFGEAAKIQLLHRPDELV